MLIGFGIRDAIEDIASKRIKKLTPMMLFVT